MNYHLYPLERESAMKSANLFQDKLTGQGERCSGKKCANVWKQKSRFYANGNGLIRMKIKPIKSEPGPGKKGHGNVVDIHVTSQVLSDHAKGFVLVEFLASLKIASFPGKKNFPVCIIIDDILNVTYICPVCC